MAKEDTTYIVEKRKGIGDEGEQKTQGVPGGYDAFGFEPFAKKSDKSTSSGEKFEKKDLSKIGDDLEEPMGKKGSGGYSKTLPENRVIMDDGFEGMGKKGNGGVM